MAEIINLKKQRKARDRARDVAEAEANRIRHGMTKAEREQIRRQAEQQRQRLDALRLDLP
jgi:DNA-binding MarR family transcriptional regulator